MALTFSRREIGFIHTLLRSTNDTRSETLPADRVPAERAGTAFPKNARLNKLIASNLRQKLQSELVERS
ncbi:MAG: hypothetical protein EXQ58_02290 [Acidobacteria bacterium]|nr:hypothetical protein [Acidobacteriota bacterium]